ncbi:MAG: hypothetical protein WC979_00685 [Candidatus Pacearchaeota archaeon]|jgi:hypothetical protein|nr:hypothetical protein [Clostridia bacterium]
MKIIERYKNLRLKITNFKVRYFYQPFADIILIYLANAKSQREFEIGYNMGLVLDTYCSYLGIELQ